MLVYQFPRRIQGIFLFAPRAVEFSSEFIDQTQSPRSVSFQLPLRLCLLCRRTRKDVAVA
jgi:hypothetical protein